MHNHKQYVTLQLHLTLHLHLTFKQTAIESTVHNNSISYLNLLDQSTSWRAAFQHFRGSMLTYYSKQANSGTFVSHTTTGHGTADTRMHTSHMHTNETSNKSIVMLLPQAQILPADTADEIFYLLSSKCPAKSCVHVHIHIVCVCM